MTTVELTDWQAALDRLGGALRILVLGATDVGKSSFIREALRRPGPELRLLDLDPGQKMIGPPGTVGLGSIAGSEVRIERFRFVGTTSANSLRQIVGAASLLARGSPGAWIANTSGFVRGPGERLQLLTIQALQPDLIVAIEEGRELEPILAAAGPRLVVRVPRSLAARRKGAGERRRLRQAALDRALSLATRNEVHDLRFWPAPPAPFESAARPLCSLVDSAGEDMCVGVLEHVDEHGLIVVHGAPPPRRPCAAGLGKIWCEWTGDDWRLVDAQRPSWRQLD